MLLYAAGCSHVAGAEIEYIEQPSCIEKAFPAIVANALNWNYTNAGKIGSNNKLIMNDTIKFVEHYLVDNTPEELFVVVGWTSVPRASVDYQDKRWFLTPGSYESRWYKTYPKLVRDWWDLELQLNGNYHDNIDDMIIQMLSLHGYLKSKNVKHVFVNMIHNLTRLDTAHKQLLSSIPASVLHNRNQSWYEYLSEKYPPMEGSMKHLQADAHKHYGEILSEFIKTNLEQSIS